MEKIKGKILKEDYEDETTEINVSSEEELQKISELIKNEEDFILQFVELGESKSELIVCEGLLSKLKTGNLKLTSKRGKK